MKKVLYWNQVKYLVLDLNKGLIARNNTFPTTLCSKRIQVGERRLGDSEFLSIFCSSQSLYKILWNYQHNLI